MDLTMPINVTLTLTEAESQVMRSILTPLHPIMREATPNQVWTEDDLFFNIALPLLTHLRTSLTEIVAVDGGLCSPNGKVWHPRLFGDRYAISMVDEDGALGTTPYVCYAINPEGDPT